MALVLILTFWTLLHIWQKLFSLRGVPSNIPWAGTGKTTGDGRLLRAKTILRSVFHTRELIEEGYYKV